MSTTDAAAGSLRRGLFVTFEGGDGSGKTTQIKRLISRLRLLNIPVLETAEPGGPPIGQQIRRILLDPENKEMDATAELLLYFAARAQNVNQWILPALSSGGVVVCDRFTDSTLVYQGYGRGLGVQVVRTLHRIACGALKPDITIYLDIDLETALERVHARNRERNGPAETRMDEQSVEFHRAVRAAYLKLAQQEPGRIRVVDARLDADSVERHVWKVLAPRVEALRAG